MYWERMSIDEYAAIKRANGLKTVKKNGIWWVEAKPFFFRPLMPFTEIRPHTKYYPLKSVIGGIQHIVPSPERTNSHMNLIALDNLQEYSLESLSKNRRQKIRKSKNHFTSRKIDNAEELIEDGFDVYLSFYNRTNYSFRNERKQKKHFSDWVYTLFNHSKILILGAYRFNKLSAISISCYVDDIIMDDTFFSDTESQKLHVSDFMFHILREAAASSNAKYIFVGFPTGQKGIDNFKLSRGCKIIRKEAYYRFNPFSLMMLKLFLIDKYKRLKGMI